MTTTISGQKSTRPYLADALKTHRLYRRIFGDLPFVVDGVAVGDAVRADVVASVFDSYAPQFVHRAVVADEMLWPLLAERDERSHEVTSRIRAKRGAILALLADAGAELRAWQRGGVNASDRTRLAGTLAQINLAMVDVLDDEVANLLPIIERDLSVAEWRELTRATRASATRRFCPAWSWTVTVGRTWPATCSSMQRLRTSTQAGSRSPVTVSLHFASKRDAIRTTGA